MLDLILLQKLSEAAGIEEKERTFEQGLPWIYKGEEPGTIIYEYKNGSKFLYDVIEHKLELRKIYPGS